MDRHFQGSQDGVPGSREDTDKVARPPEPNTAHLIDRLEQAMAHAALFGTDIEGAPKLGRFIVLRRLGAGGMSVIYEAYDPKLDRRVAVKLMRATLGDSSEGARTRLLREAQALAKLGHTNVVAVFDVGTVAEHVWLAMELVEGATLAAWAARGRRSLSEVMTVIMQAGHGLDAAHAAGLVHRDFKPDNVMIGLDGRVRVVDFGLAHGTHANDGTIVTGAPRPDVEALAIDLTVTGALRGTPAYMAPEQWRGEDVGPAADQFAWSITAWELLFGERPFFDDMPGEARSCRRPPPAGRSVPGWLRRVVERGLATAPERRWPTMSALLSALDRGRARSRKKWIAVGGASIVALAAGAEGHRRWRIEQQIAACEASGAEIEALWNDDVRTRLRSAFAATGIGHAAATAEKVMPWLDQQAEAWQKGRSESCLNAAVRRTWSEDLQDRATWCLEDRQIEMAALIEEFELPTPTTLQGAVMAAATLEPIAGCLDDWQLRRRPSPPPDEERAEIHELRMEMARARSMGRAGQGEAALAAAVRARTRAQGLKWPGLLAEARAREAFMLADTGAFEASEVAGTEAYFTAGALEDWEVAASASSYMVYTVGYQRSHPVEGRVWARHARMMIGLAGDPTGFWEAQLLNNLATSVAASGETAEARGLYMTALTKFEQALGPDHPSVALALNNIALTYHATDNFVEAERYHQRALAMFEATLGPDHPRVADSLCNLATLYIAIDKYQRAGDLLERSLVIRKQLGADHPDVALSLNNLAAVQDALGETARAKELMQQTLAIREKVLEPDHPELIMTLGNLAVLERTLGSYSEARGLFERILMIDEKKLERDDPAIAGVLQAIADIDMKMGEFSRARVLYERARGVLEKGLVVDDPNVAVNTASLAALDLAMHRPKGVVARLERAVAILDADAEFKSEALDAHFTLAKALIADGRDVPRAIDEAKNVRDGLREMGGSHAAKLVEVDRWLTARGAED